MNEDWNKEIWEAEQSAKICGGRVMEKLMNGFSDHLFGAIMDFFDKQGP
jgi:hypothetical protein